MKYNDESKLRGTQNGASQGCSLKLNLRWYAFYFYYLLFKILNITILTKNN